jgi:formylmethanofuran dehydrogenase subunit E
MRPGGENTDAHARSQEVWMSSALTEALAKLGPLHDHLCPRQVLGVRMGLYAGELLGLELPRSDKRLFVFVETDGCFADSISIATGCWLGHRTLRLIEHGKTAATFVDVRAGRAVRVWPHRAARQRVADLQPDARSRWHAQRDAYQTMDVSELFCAQPAELMLDLQAIASRPGVRVACTACGEEIANERERLVQGVPYCRGCTGERYCETAGDEAIVIDARPDASTSPRAWAPSRASNVDPRHAPR